MWTPAAGRVLLALLPVLGLGVPASSQAARPNVLLIVTDDQPAQGTMRVMPETRRIFHHGGTRFPNAVATTPNCCPSRASIMSGRYTHNHGVWHNQNNQAELARLDRESLIASRLGQVGYRTGLVGKYLNGWYNEVPPPDFDWYSMMPGGYVNTFWSINGAQRVVETYTTEFIERRARRFVDVAERDDSRPWLLYVAPFAPHGTPSPDGVTFEPEPQYARTRVGKLTRNPARDESDPGELRDKPPFWRKLVGGYTPGPGAPSAAETRRGQLRLLRSVDDLVRGLFRKLRTARETRRTLAFFVSDNGLFWGEHGAPPLKDMPYEPAIRVPLAMRWPGQLGDRRIDRRTAATIDLVPTILDAADVQGGPSVDGRSLLDRWQREYVLLEYGGGAFFPDWTSLYAPGRMQYSEYDVARGQTFREYYDLAWDPWQLDNVLLNANLADDPDVTQLSTALQRARRCEGSSCP